MTSCHLKTFLILLGSLVVVSSNAEDWIYWSSAGYNPNTGANDISAIKRAHLDGSNIQSVVTNPVSGRFGGIAFDVANSHLYSGDHSYLFRANVDGSERVNLVASLVAEVELDLIHHRVYWTDFSSVVYSANLDGSDVQALASSPNSEGLALDLADGRFYFRTGNSEISSANLDGSDQVEFLALPFLSDLFDMEIDSVARRIYWNEYYSGDHSQQRIRSANLDGPPVAEVVLNTTNGISNGMFWDEVDQKLYYAGTTIYPPQIVNGPFDIIRINSDGSNAETVISDPEQVNYIAVARGITAHAVAQTQVWIGLKNSDDVGTRFDLLAEVYKNGSPIGTGQLDGISGGSSGFNNANLHTINVSLPVNEQFVAGDVVEFKLSVRIAVNVPGHRSGTARLWFNDAAANSSVDATANGVADPLYLRNGFILAVSIGNGPKKTVDVRVDKAVGGNPFKPFGTWSRTF